MSDSHSNQSSSSSPRCLRDALGREFHYLRLSVTHRCNFRCFYCLPEGSSQVPDAQPLSFAEIGRLVAAFTGFGFWKVRLTGGEPTVRQDICEVVRRVAAAPGVSRVGLTTNGYRLTAIAQELRAGGLASLNVSLDSLDPQRFRQITGNPQLDQIVVGIEAALDAGIPSVKVNVVLLRGLDEPEIDRFLQWTSRRPLTIRFIELMETIENRPFFRQFHLPAEVIRQKLEKEGWIAQERDGREGPATNYGHPHHTGKIGLISARNSGFCNSCNRLRVSATGELRLCLFGNEVVPLRPLLQRDEDREALMSLIESSMVRKPASHHRGEGRCGAVTNLAVIGG